MTQQEHDRIELFTKNNFNRIFKEKEVFAFKEPIELFYDAYSKKPVDINKAIIREIYDHYYQSIGLVQKTSKQGDCEKKCNVCKKTLPKDNFYKMHDKKNDFDFLSWQCKSCFSEYKKQWREKNKDLLIEKKRKYYLENKISLLAKGKVWASNNKDKVNAASRKWRENNAEKMKQIRRDYELKNKEKISLRKKLKRIERKMSLDAVR